MNYLLLLSFFSFGASAAITFDYFGNVEMQTRHAWSHQAATDAGESWEQEDFNLLYGNLSGRVGVDQNSIEFNVFARYAHSNLFEEESLNTQIYNFPERIVSRDLFRLTHNEDTNDSRTDLVINKLFYEWETEDSRFVFGRMFINYGMGEVYNPINPFSTPQGITVLNNVAQGSDGLKFTLFPSIDHTINFYILGDKRYYDYDGGRYARTLWVQGEVLIDEKWQAIYIAGEDQKRFKAGFQISYQLAKGLLFAQYLRSGEPQGEIEGSTFDDYLLGFDRQINSKWHLRIEAGYQKEDLLRDYSVFDERFLPMEYFVALSNIFEVHPLVKVSASIINDPESNFNMVVFKSTYNAYSNFEVDFYALTPVRSDSSEETLGQQVISTDVGLSLRYFY